MDEKERIEYWEDKPRRVTPWNIIKWTVLAISLLVYLLVFMRLFSACDASISDDIILTVEEKATFDDLSVDYPLYHCQPSSWTNEEGTLQIKNIYYLEPISELQLTVRYRISSFDTEENAKPFYYRIRVVEGDENMPEASEELKLYEADLPGVTLGEPEVYTVSRYNYKYERICVSDVTVDQGVRTTERVQTVDADGNVTYGTKTVVEGGNRVYLDVYDSETKELFYSFAVAGKTVSGVRTRRNKVDVKVID